MENSVKVLGSFKHETAKGAKCFTISRDGDKPFGSIYVPPGASYAQVKVMLEQLDEEEDTNDSD